MTSEMAIEMRRQARAGRVRPIDAHGWTVYLATALVAISRASTVAEASQIAQDYLGDVLDQDGGATFISFETRLRLHAVIPKKEEAK
jgi:hypothetical protein